LCAVCAVDVSVVDDALAYLGCTAEVMTVDPNTLDEVMDSVSRLGDRTGHAAEARALVDELRGRLDVVAQAVAAAPRPRGLVLEWTDPPFAPGHWVPEMVERAGGVSVLGTTGQKSYRTTWDQRHAAEPGSVVCAAGGYGLDTYAELAATVKDRSPDIPVWAVDANASFARPGPRLVDGVEPLASSHHPAVGIDPVTVRS